MSGGSCKDSQPRLAHQQLRGRAQAPCGSNNGTRYSFHHELVERDSDSRSAPLCTCIGAMCVPCNAPTSVHGAPDMAQGNQRPLSRDEEAPGSPRRPRRCPQPPPLSAPPLLPSSTVLIRLRQAKPRPSPSSSMKRRTERELRRDFPAAAAAWTKRSRIVSAMSQKGFIVRQSN